MFEIKIFDFHFDLTINVGFSSTANCIFLVLKMPPPKKNRRMVISIFQFTMSVAS